MAQRCELFSDKTRFLWKIISGFVSLFFNDFIISILCLLCGAGMRLKIMT